MRPAPGCAQIRCDTVQTTIVGCSGSYPGPESPASCYLIDADGFRLSLDIGNGSLGALQRFAPLDEIDAICLSHLHTDHCIDLLSYFVVQRYHPGGPRPKIPVYGPAGAVERLARALGPEPGGLITDAFEFRTLTPGTCEIGPLRVTSAHMSHPVETFGFRIEHDGQSLAYSGDTGPTDELVKLAAGADVLLCEASFLDGADHPADLHLTAREAAQLAVRAEVGDLVLTHLVAWNDAATTFEQASATGFDGRLRLASQGLCIGERA
jgi:ribonuclease BN (tRNA processing enzyme)